MSTFRSLLPLAAAFSMTLIGATGCSAGDAQGTGSNDSADISGAVSDGTAPDQGGASKATNGTSATPKDATCTDYHHTGGGSLQCHETWSQAGYPQSSDYTASVSWDAFYSNFGGPLGPQGVLQVGLSLPQGPSFSNQSGGDPSGTVFSSCTATVQGQLKSATLIPHTASFSATPNADATAFSFVIDGDWNSFPELHSFHCVSQ